MFFKKNEVTKDERKIYIKEIERLNKQVSSLMTQLEIANSQKNEYEKLKDIYMDKTKELDALIKKTKKLEIQHESFLEALKKNK